MESSYPSPTVQPCPHPLKDNAIRVCIPAGIRDFSSTVCNNFFNNKIGGAQYICVPGGDDEGCSRMISNNQADITNVGGMPLSAV
eukprot:gene26279-17376_t